MSVDEEHTSKELVKYKKYLFLANNAYNNAINNNSIGKE